MSHEQFLSHVYSRLSTIISSDPLLSHRTLKPSIFISIRRFDHSLIELYLPQDARVFQLKQTIKQTFVEKNINWKIIWKKYTLATSAQQQQQLTNNNRRIKDYGIYNNSELIFVRRSHLK